MKTIFINSKGHWRNGWISSPPELQPIIHILRKAGMEVETVEVSSLPQLNRTFDSISSDTLVWTNAYYVDDENGGHVWLNDLVEERGLPLLGSSASTLQKLLKKDVCQTILQQAGIAIPSFTVIKAEDLAEARTIIAQSGIGFPMVLKPTAESGSVGVSMANDLETATEMAVQVLTDFPLSDVIVEAFLPSDDITCGYLEMGEEILMMPTYYLVRSTPGKKNILVRDARLRSWDGADKLQVPVTDPSILEQLMLSAPTIVDTLDIQNVTRIDGRLDAEGTLRFFDINGFPALDFPDSVLPKQCFTCFPNYSQNEVFEALINTIVHNALLHHRMKVPDAMRTHNLFTLESDLVIKTMTAQP